MNIPTTEAAPKNSRIVSLDGWRAIAILLVIASHWQLTTGFPDPGSAISNSIIKSVCWHGDLGVRIFFVLSGFLITHLLLKEARQTGGISLKKFYFRRVLRIFPVYFLYLGVLLVLQICGLYSDHKSSWFGAFTFTRNLFGRGDSSTAHFWSLAVEEQFYLIWPSCLVAFSLWRRTGLAKILLLSSVVICPIFRANMLSYHTHSSGLLGYLFVIRSIFMYADSLAMGCLGAFFFSERMAGGLRFQSPARVLFVAGSLIAAIAFFEIFAPPTKFAIFFPGIQAILIMLAIMVTIEHRAGIIYKLLNLRIMVWLGVLSYSLYVWHFLFLGQLIGPKLAGGILYRWDIWWVPALLAASASYYLWERPILRFKNQSGFASKN